MRIASAIGWIALDGCGSPNASTTSGIAATEWPIASARFSYSSVTWPLTSQNEMEALARTAAATMAIWMSRTCEASCRGRMR